MKKFLAAAVLLAAAAALCWLIWFKPSSHETADKKPDTEVPVHVAKIKRATLRGYVTVYGTVEPEPPGDHPAASARVASSVAGVVSDVKCAEGQQVEKGAILFQLDSRTADVAVEKARKAAEFAEKNLERQKKLLQVEGTSQKLLLDTEQALAAARAELAATVTQQTLLRITAPLAGTVVRINVKPGEAVDLATALAEVIDLDRLVVSSSVPSADLPALKVGELVEVPGARPITGSVQFISPQIDAKTGTAVVRATLPPGSGLRPGQFVTIRIVSEEHKDRLAVPVESLSKDAEGRTVIAIVQDDKAVQKPVETGLRDGALVEVQAEGLQVNMTVVTAGAYGLPNESKVRVVDK